MSPSCDLSGDQRLRLEGGRCGVRAACVCRESGLSKGALGRKSTFASGLACVSVLEVSSRLDFAASPWEMSGALAGRFVVPLRRLLSSRLGSVISRMSESGLVPSIGCPEEGLEGLSARGAGLLLGPTKP